MQELRRITLRVIIIIILCMQNYTANILISYEC